MKEFNDWVHSFFSFFFSNSPIFWHNALSVIWCKNGAQKHFRSLQYLHMYFGLKYEKSVILGKPQHLPHYFFGFFFQMEWIWRVEGSEERRKFFKNFDISIWDTPNFFCTIFLILEHCVAGTLKRHINDVHKGLKKKRSEKRDCPQCDKQFSTYNQ